MRELNEKELLDVSGGILKRLPKSGSLFVRSADSTMLR